jgi:hypothetical protein
LKLAEGTQILEIGADGKSVRLNGVSYGALKPGDHVVLTKDGILMVNEVARAPEKVP